jgi:hypothetical protein
MVCGYNHRRQLPQQVSNWRVHRKHLAAKTGLPCRTGRVHGSVRGGTFIIHSGQSLFVQVPLSGRKGSRGVTLLSSPRDGQQQGTLFQRFDVVQYTPQSNINK